MDDEAPIARMGSQVLEGLGYLVTTRTSSVEALGLFTSKPDEFDLIISDMTMPNMTGAQLAIEMMKIKPEIPIIIYNMPANSGLDLDADIIIAISKHPNIIGVKDSGGNLGKMASIIEDTDDLELSGFNEYVVKPVNRQILHDIIKKYT